MTRPSTDRSAPKSERHNPDEIRITGRAPSRQSSSVNERPAAGWIPKVGSNAWSTDTDQTRRGWVPPFSATELANRTTPMLEKTPASRQATTSPTAPDTRLCVSPLLAPKIS
jgi:hypothetical protein